MSGTAPPPILVHDLEIVIVVVECESSAHVTEEPWESETDYRRRTARPPLPGRPCEVLILLEETEPVDGAARVTVRLLHGEAGVWRMVGHWPSLGERWPLVITPTVRLLMSAHGHPFTHSVPLGTPTD